ncbi:MAG: hypothetical protein OXD54_09420, partial [Candidatus Poribacteria bacterium]|nr:hypothetical protein [Candidatus Poribacteria bacterium]
AEDAEKKCLNQDFQDFRISRIREEGIVSIAGLSESQKAQRTQKTLKVEAQTNSLCYKEVWELSEPGFSGFQDLQDKR